MTMHNYYYGTQYSHEQSSVLSSYPPHSSDDAIAYSGQHAGLVIPRSWVRASLALGCRVATVGQWLFAPLAWAYSTLHPQMVGKSSTSLSGWGEGRVRSLVSGSR